LDFGLKMLNWVKFLTLQVKRSRNNTTQTNERLVSTILLTSITIMGNEKKMTMHI